MPKGGSSSRLGRPSAASTTWTRTGSRHSTPVRGVCRSTWSSVSSGTSVEDLRRQTARRAGQQVLESLPARRRGCLGVRHAGRVAQHRILLLAVRGRPWGQRSLVRLCGAAGGLGRRSLGRPGGGGCLRLHRKPAAGGGPGEILGRVRTDPRQPRRARGTTRGDLGAGHDVWVCDVVVRPLLRQASSTSHWRPEPRSAPRPFVLQEGSGLNVAAIRVSLPGVVVTHHALADSR